MILSIVFTFIVLLFTSCNIIIALYSVLAIGGVVSNVMAFIYLLGWQLGASESIAMVLFIGFSVDYVVHMGHQYVESIHETKK